MGLVTKIDRRNLMKRCTNKMADGTIMFLAEMIDRHKIHQLLVAAVDAASSPDEDD